MIVVKVLQKLLSNYPYSFLKLSLIKIVDHMLNCMIKVDDSSYHLVSRKFVFILKQLFCRIYII